MLTGLGRAPPLASRLRSASAMTMPNSSEPSGLEQSIRAILSSDHQELERSLAAVVGGAAGADAGDLGDAWPAFERHVAAHLDSEEAHVFPAFARSHPDEARELRDEHEQIRARLIELAIDLHLHCLDAGRVRAFADELRAHAAHEERVLYPWAAQHLGKLAGAHIQRALPASPGAAPDAPARRRGWMIDATRSSLGFSLSHIIAQDIKGRFTRWGGTLFIDEVDPTASRLHAWVDLASIDTGEPERDRQVRSAAFFDVDRYPRATFTSTEIRIPGAGNPFVRGRLSLHGKEVDVDLEIVSREEIAGDRGVQRAAYTVKARIDRRPFGLGWHRDLDVGGIAVGTHVEIEARVEAVAAARRP
jgi:polyisoprenoid-binding protein YceI